MELKPHCPGFLDFVVLIINCGCPIYEDVRCVVIYNYGCPINTMGLDFDLNHIRD